ncbi:hypothetical protein LIA77_02662 [Sarocladium implicatum]|nr:hypothetical protein LIA77_02662 [Sarocladium implicatum]
MDRMYDNGFRVVCHFARIVPAAAMYASALMLVACLQENDGKLYVVPWFIFASSAGILAQTHHRTFSAVKFGRIASIMSLPSVVRLMIDSTTDTTGLPAFQGRVKLIVAEYLARTSLVAFALAVGYTCPETKGHDTEAVGTGDDSPPWFEKQSIRSNLWYIHSPKSNSEEFVGPEMTSVLSEVSSICFGHMGPPSRSSSLPSTTHSDISLHYDSDRVEPAKKLHINWYAQVAMSGRPDQDLQTLPLHNHEDLP